jgi:anaphase-promoting complex subunit 8
MKNFFVASFCMEKFSNQCCLDLIQKLLYFFRNSNFLLSQVATCYYNTQEYDHSLEAFEKLIDLDPYRFENMDTYSNILYIKES